MEALHVPTGVMHHRQDEHLFSPCRARPGPSRSRVTAHVTAVHPILRRMHRSQDTGRHSLYADSSHRQRLLKVQGPRRPGHAAARLAAQPRISPHQTPSLFVCTRIPRAVYHTARLFPHPGLFAASKTPAASRQWHARPTIHKTASLCPRPRSFGLMRVNSKTMRQPHDMLCVPVNSPHQAPY